MAFLEEEDLAGREEVCVVLHRQVGKEDAADLCAAVQVALAQVLWDEVLPLQATTTTTTKLLTDKALLHVSSHHTAKVIEVCPRKLHLR